ncbi:putative histone H2B.1 [Trifolium repens]|nr:putative histone H2B.1 [Trifolium repens]
MPPHKKPGPVNKNRTAVTVTVAEDINEKKNMLNFNNEILHVLKQVHPNIPITWGALDVMNTIISKMMRRLVRKSYRLNSLRRKKPNLSVKDIDAAVMEAFPPHMAKLALTAARNALTDHHVGQLSDKMDQTMSIKDINDSVMEAPTDDHRASELSAIMDRKIPRDNKPAAVKKNRTAAVEDVDDEKKKNMFKFKNEILRVLKQVHPNIAITCGALEVTTTIINNMMLKLVQKSFKRNSLRRNKSKLSINDIMSAVMELFPPQMAKLARTAARKALTNHRVTQLTHKIDRTMSINDINDAAVMEAPTDHRVKLSVQYMRQFIEKKAKFEIMKLNCLCFLSIYFYNVLRLPQPIAEKLEKYYDLGDLKLGSGADENTAKVFGTSLRSMKEKPSDPKEDERIKRKRRIKLKQLQRNERVSDLRSWRLSADA